MIYRITIFFIIFHLYFFAFAATSEIDRYLNSLESQIEAFTFKLEKEPNSIPTLQILSSLWYEKSGYSGSLFDTKRAIEFSTKAISLASKAYKTSKTSKNFHEKSTLIELYLSRAHYQMRVHNFPSVKLDLKKARSLTTENAQIDDIELDLKWNLGNYQKPLEDCLKKLKTNPTIAIYIRIAGYYFGLGNFQESNKNFEIALNLDSKSLYLNPVQKAWVHTQIGINHYKLKMFDNSEKSFQEALKIAPNYVMALEHYAEVLLDLGKINESMNLYEKVVSLSDDPEFKGQLAKLYQKIGKMEEASKLIATAKDQFIELLKLYPEAMYWHASEFFTELLKDYNFAYSLLIKNLKLRPNSDSYLALAKVQMALNKKELARKSILKVLNFPTRNEEICIIAREILPSANPQLKAKCGSIN